MMAASETIEEIVRLEWEMFSTVRNAGGPADCQLDPATFTVMRRSQAGAWPEALAGSYLEDLKNAAREGRNLMTEKYARMMQFTHPGEYARIRGALPAVDEKTLARIEEIVAVNVRWKLETAARYPALNNRGRAIRSADDARYGASFESYLRGELKTYSPRSIELLHKHTLEMEKEGRNGVEATLLLQAREYGHASLQEAEANLRG